MKRTKNGDVIDNNNNNKKARVEYSLFCVVNLTTPDGTEREVYSFTSSSRDVIDRVYRILLEMRVDLSESIVAVILGGLTITPCHWDPTQYAAWHGIATKRGQSAHALIEMTIDLIREIAKHSGDARWNSDAELKSTTQCTADDKFLLISCERVIPDEEEEK